MKNEDSVYTFFNISIFLQYFNQLQSHEEIRTVRSLVTASVFFIIGFDVAMEKMTESTKLGLFSLTGAVIVLCSVGCEIGKQISNYSINYYNGGSYPQPQTILVRLRPETQQTLSRFTAGHPLGSSQASCHLL